jgi:multidrug efflux pump
LLGTYSLLKLSFEQYPFLAPPTIRVTATYPGASAMAVEQSVTTRSSSMSTASTG